MSFLIVRAGIEEGTKHKFKTRSRATPPPNRGVQRDHTVHSAPPIQKLDSGCHAGHLLEIIGCGLCSLTQRLCRPWLQSGVFEKATYRQEKDFGQNRGEVCMPQDILERQALDINCSHLPVSSRGLHRSPSSSH